ncbi:hypothetical protein CGK04_22405 [Vibrio parahaemolyticus]|nr:hypothetical protein VPUCM_1115 [Vibrio parahaemolyticus UCM-V493]ETJ90510.1 hypothetical protein D041_2918 [Vibrio parahaemolyticus EKP-008]ETJ92962.1 hypothetical protein D029_0365 [Vibrio parahaemolyticus 970107]ETT15711.1 hypothetical protein D028_2584 [Vibrio parahaemolyticus 50]EXJ30432.1 hypothetical protein D050_3738 [Vibrio parahaemolyticus VPCR-2009]EXJ31776.1 hypothetical protein D048_0390 [Vibrio parahaemolyticus VPTS-2009]EXJ44860.1 hypothetical protein D049_2026 [Vibrio parah
MKAGRILPSTKTSVNSKKIHFFEKIALKALYFFVVLASKGLELLIH